MATSERRPNGRFSWLDAWWLPFLWVILTPLVIIPLSAILFFVVAGYQEAEEIGRQTGREGGWFGPPEGCVEGRYADCTGFGVNEYRYSEVWLTAIAFILPGLVLVAPFLWVWSKDWTVKAAALVSGLLGLLHLSVPSLVLASAQTVPGGSGGSYFRFVTEGFMTFAGNPFDPLWAWGFVVWLGCLLVWAIFAIVLAVLGLWRGRDRMTAPFSSDQAA